MPTIGDLLIEYMKKTPPGIKGTPSEEKPLGDSLISQLKAETTTEPAKESFWPSWLQTPLTTGMSIVGELLGKFKKKTKETEEVEIPYADKVKLLINDLQGRGYSNDEIQKVINKQAEVYGEEPIIVSPETKPVWWRKTEEESTPVPTSPYPEYPDAYQENGIWYVTKDGHRYRIEE